jgi:predicted amidophosphoribosyltransferase
LVRRALIDVTLPPICAGCDRDIDSGDGLPLCQPCQRSFTLPGDSICTRCAAPAPAPSIRPTGCPHCEKTSFRFQHIASLGVYQGRLQSLVVRMKHSHGEALAITSGRLLAARIRELAWPSQPELVTAAPMHWTRRLWRGVNAAAVLAEATAAELRLPLALDLLRSVRNVPRQSSLTPNRRRHNMRAAFLASGAFNLHGVHVLVIDDVLTTGATANALAQALRLGGAKVVSIGVVARGIGLV